MPTAVAADDASGGLVSRRETGRVGADSSSPATDGDVTDAAESQPSEMTFERLNFTESGAGACGTAGNESPHSSVILGPKREDARATGGSNPFAEPAETRTSGYNPFLDSTNPFLAENSKNPFYSMPTDFYSSNFEKGNPFLCAADVAEEAPTAGKNAPGHKFNAVTRERCASALTPSPGSSPRSNRHRAFRESRRISIDKTGRYLHLNQYRLLESIGQVSPPCTSLIPRVK